MEKLPEEDLVGASYLGRNFEKSGGGGRGSAADATEFKPNAGQCSGLEECFAAITKASKGKLDANFIEGMACVGGCIGGAACLTSNNLDKYALSAGHGRHGRRIPLRQDLSCRIS